MTYSITLTRLLLTFLIGVIITISSCKKDEVEFINPCNSYQTYVQGTCTCPTGYKGNKCDEQVNPEKMMVTKIELLKFPGLRLDSTVWDSLDRPDLHVTFYQAAKKLWESPSTIVNADPSKVYVFDLTPGVEMPKYSNLHTLTVYDDDGNKVDEFMGGALVTPYSDSTKFPESKVVNMGGVVVFKLYYKYEF
jgi:hypothetical protein